MNFSGRGLALYGNVKIMTASPADQVVMLYDAAFKFLREAVEASKAGDRARMGQRIGQANKTFACLLASLDRTVLPTLCEQLEGLYQFSMRQLLQANISNDPEKLLQVIALLSPLRDAWATAAAQLVRDSVPKPATATAPAAAAR